MRCPRVTGNHSREGTIKVLDFGLARAAGGAEALQTAGAPLGTPAFMSPRHVGAGTSSMAVRISGRWARRCSRCSRLGLGDLVEARFNRALARLGLGDRAGARADLEHAQTGLFARQDTVALATVRELLAALEVDTRGVRGR